MHKLAQSADSLLAVVDYVVVVVVVRSGEGAGNVGGNVLGGSCDYTCASG